MESPSSLRVLLVDPDAAGRRAALDLLRRLGVAADGVGDGDAAVRRCVGAPYDVVLMDLDLPVMGGIETLRALRTLLPAGRQPRVVAVTGRTAEGVRETALAAGFDGFYAKPADADALREALGIADEAPAASAYVARPAHLRDEAAEATARTLYAKVCAHVADMLGEEDPEFVADLVESFAASSREAVADAQATRSAGDAAGLAAAAHRLKGSASNVGLDAIARWWTEVEETARGGVAHPDAVDRALRETAQAVALLEAHV